MPHNFHYQTFQEFLDDVKSVKRPFMWSGSDRDVLYASHEDAMRLAEQGWPEGVKQIAPLAATLTNRISALMEVPQLRYDTEGLDFDMGEYMAGTPEHWYTLEHSIQEGRSNKILTFKYNFGARAYVTGQTMQARGYVAAALVQLLEVAGFRVHLVAVNRVKHLTNDGYDFVIPVKQADQPLDIDRLAFILAHPAMLRRLGFAVRTKISRSIMGSSIDLPESEQGDIYINAGEGSEWHELESAQAYILKELKRQGVAITESK